MSTAEGERIVSAALAVACERATTDMRALLDDMTAAGLEVRAAGIAFKTYRVPTSLDAIVRSHPLCHAAEGQLTTDALFAACEAVGLPVTTMLVSDGVDPRAEGVGKVIGPPWRKDHKLAASAALRAAN